MKIIHVFRSPIGGLFRHVCDLAREQRLMGHDVGVICDQKPVGDAAESALAELDQFCNLGLTRIEITTLPSRGDLAALRHVKQTAQQAGANVIHGHGAKGGVYARLAARKTHVAGVYSPHGGSLHYDWLKPPGAAYLAAERLLRFEQNGIIFVCAFERDLFQRKIGVGRCKNTVIYNGLQPQEFTTRKLASDATDFLFVGEMRGLKGVDVLLEAIARARQTASYTLTLIGDGPDLTKLERRATKLDLSEAVRFVGRRPIAEALPLGRILVMPSRHESFPYVVLEAVAAKVPVIASRVGGIPEILPDSQLVAVGDAPALARAMINAAQDMNSVDELQSKLARSFTVRRMAEQTLAFYESLH